MMPVLIRVFYHSQPLRKASKSEADASYEHKHISIPHLLEKLQVSSVGIGDKTKRNYPPSTGISRSKEKRNQKRETTIVSIEMLEGAKSIGVGAATIALAGAAVGIGNVLSSSIHSVA
jgi:hypothetical protein